MNWYLKVLTQYSDFNGRARRKEYWMFVLFNSFAAIIGVVFDNILGFTINQTGYGFIYLIYILAVFVPNLAVSVRRLHDIGKSGWMLLVALIPIAGAIWLLVLMVKNGTPGSNQYGPDPKAADQLAIDPEFL